MKIAQLLQQRQRNWKELEQLCDRVRGRRVKSLGPEGVSRFAALYRAACADLALADAYQLPPGTVRYLHRLVGRAHNQLYRSRTFDFAAWVQVLLVETPQRIFNDRCVQVACCLFWGLFILSAYLAHRESVWPGYAEQVLTKEGIEQLETMFQQPLAGRDWDENLLMAGFYIFNNTWIGLKCFVGCLFILPGLLITAFNAAFLGASFGYMFRPDVAAGANFREFVMAHGPFELTAIVLSAGAGLRLGVSCLVTGGLTRLAALQKAGREAMPIMGAAMVLFCLAALIEGFVSPSSLPGPLAEWSAVFKGLVCLVCSAMLLFYFVVLGFPRRT